LAIRGGSSLGEPDATHMKGMASLSATRSNAAGGTEISIAATPFFTAVCTLPNARTPIRRTDSCHCSTMPSSDEPIRLMTLDNMRSLGVRSLFATCRTSTMRPRSTSTHGHPRIRCTQTAMPTAITKNSGSATAKPTAFASISAPAFAPWARSHRTYSDNVPVPSFGPRRCGAAGAVISVPRRSRIGSSGGTACPGHGDEPDCRAKARAGNTPVLKEWGDPHSENHARGTRGLGAVWAGGRDPA
jgi:hypothetical protein